MLVLATRGTIAPPTRAHPLFPRERCISVRFGGERRDKRRRKNVDGEAVADTRDPAARHRRRPSRRRRLRQK